MPRSTRPARSWFAITAASVNSRQRVAGSAPERSSASRTTVTVSLWRHWRGLRFTHTTAGSPGRSAAHIAACRAAEPIAHAPIGNIRPASSATSRNSPGVTRPRLRWPQRSSASQPMIEPERRRKAGW